MDGAEFIGKTVVLREEALVYEMLDHGQALQQLVFTYVKDYATAEDLTQDILIKAYKKLHTFQNKSTLKTWLFRIAINHCKDYLKSWHYRKVELNNDVVQAALAKEKQVEQTFIQKTEEQWLVETILQLPLKYREAIYLYYYEDWTTKRISQITGENENTIKTRINRAKKMIKAELSKEGME